MGLTLCTFVKILGVIGLIWFYDVPIQMCYHSHSLPSIILIIETNQTLIDVTPEIFNIAFRTVIYLYFLVIAFRYLDDS